jgi:hypothetical protein
MISTTFDTDYAAWCAKRKAESQAQRACTLRTMRRVRTWDPILPLSRVWLHGPRWHRLLANTDGLIEYDRELGLSIYDFTDDVRELVCEPIRHDVYAMWTDPRERWRA